MNVQHYFAAVSEGMFALMVRLGLSPEEICRRRRSFAVVRAETDFQRELRAGDVICLESTVLKVGEKSVTFQHRLKNVTTGDTAMSTVFKCVILDLESRQAMVTLVTFGQPLPSWSASTLGNECWVWLGGAGQISGRFEISPMPTVAVARLCVARLPPGQPVWCGQDDRGLGHGVFRAAG
jgi:acyl-CoA thioesterase FadM